MATHLVWFRADLRIHDNLALAAACRDPHARVLGLFIATPGQWRQHGMAPRQAAFMVSHLHSLQAALAEKGIPLQIEHAGRFHRQRRATRQHLPAAAGDASVLQLPV